MPDWKPEIRKRLTDLNLSPPREAEIIEELSQHLTDRYRDAIAAGATEVEACHRALTELSDDDLLSRELKRTEKYFHEPVVPGVGRSNMMADLWQDLRYAFRTMAKQPGFAAVAIITLALGIGANSAIFSIINAILLEPLPYSNSDRLVMVWETVPARKTFQNVVAPGNFVTWREQNRSFEDMASYNGGSVNITGNGEPEKVDAIYCTDNLLSILGVSPIVGRTFMPGDAQQGDFAGAVLSYGYWQRRFGADPSIVGKKILIDGYPVTMTGVMPKTFHFPAPGVDLWLGTAMSQSTAGTLEAHYLKVVGRLKPGISYQQASADIDAVATRMQEQYPKTNRYVSASINPLYEQQVGDVRPALLMLFVASAFVLLIACANVANLLLARAATRQKEIAIRLALGSGRFRLTRQLITESLLLAAIGGIFGLQIGFWGLKALSSLTPTNLIPQTPISMNGKLMGFTILASLLTGLIFGLVPAIQATKTDLNETLKDTGRDSVSGGRTKLRSLLVVAELALALILMVGAGLMMNSYLLLNSVDTGLKTKNVLTLKASPPYSKYPDIAQRAAFYDQILDRIQALPNVESAAVINGLPMSDDLGEMTYFPEGPNPPKVFNALPRTVSTTYFQTLGIPILRGRSFIPQDNANVPIVLVVNESMAKLCWPGEDPIGKRIHVGIMAAPLVTVVGVVKDTHSRLGEPPRPQVFQSYAQSASFAPGDLIVKAKSDPLSIVAAVRDAVWQVDKDQPVSSIATMDSVMANSIARERFNMLLLSIFAGLALVLASIGIYGVMSYVVAHGTRELGIRLALGAQKHDILTLVIGKAMILSLTGVAIGTIGALLLTRLISKMIYGVKPTDPSTFVGVAVLLTAIAIIACYLPARRAIKIDPVVALRCE